MLCPQSASRMLQKTIQIHEKKVGSVASLTVAFIIRQYFIINKGVCHFLSFPLIFFYFPASFNDFALKFLIQSTDRSHISFP